MYRDVHFLPIPGSKRHPDPGSGSATLGSAKAQSLLDKDRNKTKYRHLSQEEKKTDEKTVQKCKERKLINTHDQLS